MADSRGIRALAGTLERLGQVGADGQKDTILAHINPSEYDLLTRISGNGRPHPLTGLPQFYQAGEQVTVNGQTFTRGSDGAFHGASSNGATWSVQDPNLLREMVGSGSDGGGAPPVDTVAMRNNGATESDISAYAQQQHQQHYGAGGVYDQQVAAGTQKYNPFTGKTHVKGVGAVQGPVREDFAGNRVADPSLFGANGLPTLPSATVAPKTFDQAVIMARQGLWPPGGGFGIPTAPGAAGSMVGTSAMLPAAPDAIGTPARNQPPGDSAGTPIGTAFPYSGDFVTRPDDLLGMFGLDVLSQFGSTGADGQKDTMMAHLSPSAAGTLKKAGGSGDINPRTGLREYATKDTFDADLYRRTYNFGDAPTNDDLWRHYEVAGRQEGRIANADEQKGREEGYTGIYGAGGYGAWKSGGGLDINNTVNARGEDTRTKEWQPGVTEWDVRQGLAAAGATSTGGGIDAGRAWRQATETAKDAGYSGGDGSIDNWDELSTYLAWKNRQSGSPGTVVGGHPGGGGYTPTAPGQPPGIGYTQTAPGVWMPKPNPATPGQYIPGVESPTNSMPEGPPIGGDYGMARSPVTDGDSYTPRDRGASVAQPGQFRDKATNVWGLLSLYGLDPQALFFPNRSSYAAPDRTVPDLSALSDD